VKFKLDENLGRRGAELVRMAGHDVATVFLEVLERQPLGRELWIVEPGRVRIHASDEDASPGSG
jgi:hypothetical protein